MSKSVITFCNKSLQQLKMIATMGGGNLVGLSVKSGGCNGLKYDIAPRAERFDNDEFINFDGVDVTVCPKSLLFIAGTHIHWKTDNMSSGFVFDNPNASGKCGCGTTFNL